MSDTKKQDLNNKEYRDGYNLGRNGDWLLRNFAIGFLTSSDSVYKKGYDAGRADYFEHDCFYPGLGKPTSKDEESSPEEVVSSHEATPDDTSDCYRFRTSSDYDSTRSASGFGFWKIAAVLCFAAFGWWLFAAGSEKMAERQRTNSLVGKIWVSSPDTQPVRNGFHRSADTLIVNARVEGDLKPTDDVSFVLRYPGCSGTRCDTLDCPSLSCYVSKYKFKSGGIFPGQPERRFTGFKKGTYYLKLKVGNREINTFSFVVYECPEHPFALAASGFQNYCS